MHTNTLPSTHSWSRVLANTFPLAWTKDYKFSLKDFNMYSNIWYWILSKCFFISPHVTKVNSLTWKMKSSKLFLQSWTYVQLKFHSTDLANQSICSLKHYVLLSQKYVFLTTFICRDSKMTAYKGMLRGGCVRLRLKPENGKWQKSLFCLDTPYLLVFQFNAEFILA